MSKWYENDDELIAAARRLVGGDGDCVSTWVRLPVELVSKLVYEYDHALSVLRDATDGNDARSLGVLVIKHTTELAQAYKEIDQARRALLAEHVNQIDHDKHKTLWDACEAAAAHHAKHHAREEELREALAEADEDRREALRIGYEVTLECQTLGEMTSDLVRLVRLARQQRDELQKQFDELHPNF